MIPIDLDQIYWFTRLALQNRRAMLPVRRMARLAIVVSIPKNTHGIKSGFYIAEPSRLGSLIPVEGPYRSRIIAAVAAVS